MLILIPIIVLFVLGSGTFAAPQAQASAGSNYLTRGSPDISNSLREHRVSVAGPGGSGGSSPGSAVGSVTGAETAPVISNVAVMDIGQASATITWQTDISSDSVVNLGSAFDDLSITATDPVTGTGHAVPFTGLTPQMFPLTSIS